MPRSASDGGANHHLLRNVFAKSALGFNSFKEDTIHLHKKGLESSVTEIRQRTQSIFHTRSASHSIPGQAEQYASSGLLKKRRSIARLESLRPSSQSRHYPTIWSPSSPTVTEVLYSPAETETFTSEAFYGRVLQHGEVHSSSVPWRKKTEYLVLTENYLLRFKSLKKAAESFPSLASQASNVSRQNSIQSYNSSSPVDSVPSGSSGTDSPTEPAAKSSIWLQYLIAAQVVHESRAHATVEIVWDNNAKSNVSILPITVDRHNGQPHWLESLSSIAKACRSENIPSPSPIHQKAINEAVEKNLDSILDDRSSQFLVHPRPSNGSESGFVVPDELSKDLECLRFLVIGKNKTHLIPITPCSTGLTRSHSDTPVKALSYGTVGLKSVSINDQTNSLTLIFSQPRLLDVVLDLSSMHCQEIAQLLYTQLEYLRPKWVIEPSLFKVSPDLQSQLGQEPVAACPPCETFSRVLDAYCAAWNIRSETIIYDIDVMVEDKPKFRLKPRGKVYQAHELLAVFRALRYNEYFATISFANIVLDSITSNYGQAGYQDICLDPVIGPPLKTSHVEVKETSLLYQEISAIVMTNRKLRRLDLTSCIYRHHNEQIFSIGENKGCDIVEALYSLCSNQNTNLDWIILSGIRLSQVDSDHIVEMLANKDCHLRAIELSGCHLDTYSLRAILSELPKQWRMLEGIDISNNPGAIDPEVSFPVDFGSCNAVRSINLSRIHLKRSVAPLIPRNILFSWKLEDIKLSWTSLNDQTMTDLVEYLHSPASKQLQSLYLDNCGLSIDWIAKIFDALAGHDSGSIHLDISSNSISSVAPAIASLQNCSGLRSLSWKLLDFHSPDEFGHFIQALTANTTITHLDLSELLLEFDLNIGLATDLRTLFAENKVLKSISLAGNNSILDSSQFGPLVGEALAGLAQNTTLERFYIERQAIGLVGATALATVLTSNSTLKELHCGSNEIPLAGWSALLDSLQGNNTLLYIADPEPDGQRDLNAVMKSGAGSHEARRRATEVKDVTEKYWQHQYARRKEYLERNFQSSGLRGGSSSLHHHGRTPVNSTSLLIQYPENAIMRYSTQFKTEEEVQDAYRVALQGGVSGAARWGFISALAGATAMYFSPVFRGVTVQYKVFLQMASMTMGGFIEADRRMVAHELVVRQRKRAERQRVLRQEFAKEMEKELDEIDDATLEAQIREAELMSAMSRKKRVE
ncbi:RNI-like protein [Microthyrium microscopicum]|uniref:RNI-like protein n=1 Tax=Microthyrium microscopicum TaxID=703497 RepID=A0A6A6U5D6_9PEZI|nr:RNI-like protein [Microthyrium microscopicum]